MMILILSYYFNPTHDLFLNVTKLQLKKYISLTPLEIKFTKSESKNYKPPSTHGSQFTIIKNLSHPGEMPRF